MACARWNCRVHEPPDFDCVSAAEKSGALGDGDRLLQRSVARQRATRMTSNRRPLQVEAQGKGSDATDRSPILARAYLGYLAGLSAEQIDLERELGCYGLDSVDAVLMAGEMEQSIRN